jgi:CheY-like chemotaxis protein
MHRKILVVEQTDTMRTVAETLLRQNGYEVIAVSAAEKAREVLELSRPDLMIVGADVQTPDGNPLYERLRHDETTGSIPMLLFEPADKSPLDYPPEVVIPRPFDPRDFISRVSVMIGKREKVSASGGSGDNALAVSDTALDEALGLDDLKITDSEDMDKSSTSIHIPNGPTADKLTGLESAKMEDDLSESSKVESIMIGDEDSKIIRESERKKAVPPEGSAKLEILSDQYGLSDQAALGGQDDEGGVHDYDWFIEAIRNDAEGHPGGAGPAEGSSGKLSIEDPSVVVEPVTPANGRTGSSEGPGVEKFIDEFKKEMEQIREADGEELVEPAAPSAAPPAGDRMNWEDKVERLTPEQIEPFTREFARQLGERVAEKIVSKIDSEKLLKMIKSELLKRLPDK